MTRRISQWQRWSRLPLAIAVAAGLSGQAAAYSFYVGDVEASFNTTLSAGVSWRTEESDRRLIGQGNLPDKFNGTTEGASTINYDDGNLNFDKGDTISKIVKGNSELYLNYDVDSSTLTRVGSFVRGRYWYDFELKDESRAADANGRVRELNPEAKDNASGAEFLDAYVFTDWYFGNVPVSVRYGNQVVSWGESTFIQGGINVINPIDVQAFRAPGSELKDALLPVEMLYMSAGVTENLSVESFVQTDWEPIRPDDCGTFFSTNDFAADGCGPVWPQGTLSEAESKQLDAQSGGNFKIARDGDREADEKDQFGVALRWYVPALNDSELGFYYIKYNSRLPYVSGVVNENPNGADQSPRDFPQYFIEYPENIDLYGISINTSVPGGWSLGAEYSFRDGVPLQWNAFELLLGGLQTTVDGEDDGLPVSLLQRQREQEAGCASTDNDCLDGLAISGYDRYGVSQLQFTLLKFFEQVMGANRLTFITEFGATYVHDLPGLDEARYGRSGTFGVGPVPFVNDSGAVEDACPNENINPSNCVNDGYTTDFSWGYRARMVWEYNNAFAGINLLPQIAWSHDVQGYSPQPGGAFNEGSKAIGLSMQAVYLNRITGNIGYTNFFDGKPYNELTDRDFVSASVSYSF